MKFKNKLVENIVITVAAVAVVFAGYSVYMEVTNGTEMLKETSMSEEKILAERPDIAISDEDIALGEALLGSIHVTSTMDLNEPISMSLSEVSDDLAGVIPGEHTLLEVAVLDKDYVTVTLTTDEGDYIVYTFKRDDTTPMEKVIDVFGEDDEGHFVVKAIYNNKEGVITKSEIQRIWFYWLTNALEK